MRQMDGYIMFLSNLFLQHENRRVLKQRLSFCICLQSFYAVYRETKKNIEEPVASYTSNVRKNISLETLRIFNFVPVIAWTKNIVELLSVIFLNFTLKLPLAIRFTHRTRTYIADTRLPLDDLGYRLLYMWAINYNNVFFLKYRPNNVCRHITEIQTDIYICIYIYIILRNIKLFVVDVICSENDEPSFLLV